MASAAPARSAARVALIGLRPETAQTFSGTFRNFSIESVVITNGTTLPNEAFRACVVQLGADSDKLVQQLRRNGSHLAIMGVCAQPTEMARYARLGLTALLAEPVDQAAVERIVKGTQLLIAGELRKHVRIPIVLEVEFRPDSAAAIVGLTRELSNGGLSIMTNADISPDHSGDVSLKLPSGQKVNTRATVVWRHHPDLLGLKFAAEDPQREVIRKWIDEYLELG
ncbi:MAG: PilZ domain-containing protein [Acidobacteriales bacterium]|nr:PilZ domain-containing protein [Terriglobales bacterium]